MKMFANRHFEKINGSHVNVLVIDRNGLDHIKKCIPEGMSYGCIDTRHSIPFVLRPHFVFRLLVNSFKCGFSYMSLLYSIIDIMKPKVVMSFTDNSRMNGRIGTHFPNMLVLSVQNGVRTLPDDFRSLKEQFRIPKYFCFGSYEKDLISHLEVPFDEIMSVGSLKLGIFLSEHYDVQNNNKICFVSQYISRFEKSEDKITRDILGRMQRVFGNLSDSVGGSNVTVAMRCDEQDIDYASEKDFYLKINRNANLVSNKKIHFSSYKIAYSSPLIVAMDSTLAFEMYGIGKKVLFCDLAKDKEFSNRLGVEFLFNQLPIEVVLETLSEIELKNKMNVLLTMSESEYRELTKESRDYFIKKSDNFPHEKISIYLKNRTKTHEGQHV